MRSFPNLLNFDHNILYILPHMGVSNLRRKTVNGFFWSALEMVFSQGQGILYGIVLARLLSPNEFGLLGMVTIFIAIAQVFVDSYCARCL